MKRIFMASVALTVFALSIVLFQMTSCRKAEAQTVVKNDTVYLTKIDSVCPSSTLSDTALLTQHPWKCNKLIAQIGNTAPFDYVRNSINTTPYATSDLDGEKYVFNANGTGTLYDGPGGSTPESLTWAFAPGDETTIALTVHYTSGPVIPFAWSFVEITAGTLSFTQNYYNASNYVMSQQTYVPAQ
jgi:hypothetical protein